MRMLCIVPQRSLYRVWLIYLGVLYDMLEDQRISWPLYVFDPFVLLPFGIELNECAPCQVQVKFAVKVDDFTVLVARRTPFPSHRKPSMKKKKYSSNLLSCEQSQEMRALRNFSHFQCKVVSDKG